MKKNPKRKINRKGIILISIILVLLILIFLYRYIYGINLLKQESDNNSNDITNNTNQKEDKKVYQANMIMVGDVLVHDRLYNDAYNGQTYDFSKYFKHFKDYVKDKDIAYYNQETILGGTSIGLSSYPSFNSPQEVGDAMVNMGFNLVSLATNHTLDRGEKAILLSREYWNNQKDVQAVGSYSSIEEKKALETKVLEVNGITYAMLNYTYGTNGISVPSGKDYLINLWDDTKNYEGYKETVKNDIATLRDKVDVLIVAMHWGREYTHTPTELEKETAKFLASLDVDIIIGTHPHVIQPVEFIDDTLVFYSLGNFISAQTSDSCANYKCFVGLMPSLTITKTIENDKTSISIDNISNDLVFTYHNNYKDYQVIPFSSPSIKEYLNDYQTIYDNYSKIILSNDERIKLVPVAN